MGANRCAFCTEPVAAAFQIPAQLPIRAAFIPGAGQETAEVRLHDQGVAQGAADMAFTLNKLPIGLTAEQLAYQTEKALAEHREKLDASDAGTIGFGIRNVADPMRALERFRQQPFDLLVVNAGTTGEDGFFVFECIVEEARQMASSWGLAPMVAQLDQMIAALQAQP